jgi:hypothetical protein
MQTLGRSRRGALQEVEVAALDASAMTERRGHAHGRRLEPDLGAVVAPERRGEAALDHGDAIQLLQKVDVEEGAPELAVGNAEKPDLLLAPHHALDRRVLDLAQGLGGGLAAGMPLARLEQALWPQEAADVIGAVRWRDAGHGGPPTFEALAVRSGDVRALLSDHDSDDRGSGKGA